MSSGVAKIQKLLRLARSQNRHEAEAARARAQELMDELGVAVSLDDEPRVVVVVDDQPDYHREQLAHYVAISRGCGAGLNAGGHLAVRGKKKAAENAADVYNHLVQIGRQGEVLTGDPPPVAKRMYRHVFWLSFVTTIRNRLTHTKQHVSNIPQPISEQAAAATYDKDARANEVRQELNDDTDDLRAEDYAEVIIHRLKERAMDAGAEFAERAYLPTYREKKKTTEKSHRARPPLRTKGVRMREKLVQFLTLTNLSPEKAADAVIEGTIYQYKFAFEQASNGKLTDGQEKSIALLERSLNTRRPEFVDGLLRICAAEVTETDLDNALAFYATETGKKILAMVPNIMEEVNAASEEWVKYVIGDIEGEWKKLMG